MLGVRTVTIRTGDAHKGLNSKIPLAVDAHGMPIRMFVTAGTVADCSQACRLVEGIPAEYLLADKGNDSDALVEAFTKDGIQPLIPLRKGRKLLRAYDTYTYRFAIPSKMRFWN